MPVTPLGKGRRIDALVVAQKKLECYNKCFVMFDRVTDLALQKETTQAAELYLAARDQIEICHEKFAEIKTSGDGVIDQSLELLALTNKLGDNNILGQVIEKVDCFMEALNEGYKANMKIWDLDRLQTVEQKKACWTEKENLYNLYIQKATSCGITADYPLFEEISAAFDEFENMYQEVNKLQAGKHNMSLTGENTVETTMEHKEL